MIKTIIGTALLFSLLAIPGIRVYAQKGMETEILANINKYRVEKGLPVLVANDKIEKAAITHSHDMAEGKIPLGHDGFNERMAVLMKALAPANACAENVADGATTADEVVNLWLHSPGHRKNIEGNYNLTGIGVVADKNGKKYYTQIFIKSGR
jgi:uncharacterized protein YkwD